MSCEFCAGPGGDMLWRDASCRVVSVVEPGYSGFCRVVWNAHVKEMTDLAESDRAHLMRVVFAVEHALRELLAPEKMNLASFGNVAPHLHWHVIPRFTDDPHFPQAFWGKQQRDPLPAPRVMTREKLAAALGSRLS